MTDEEIQALKSAKEAAEATAIAAQAEAAEAKAKAAKAESDKLGLVEEVKTERQKKQEALDKLNITNGGPVDVNTLVEEALKNKDNARRKAELEQAISEFKSSKPEFQADSAGLVFNEFTKHLEKFNLDGLNTKEQAKSRLEEIYRFVNYKTGDDTSHTYDGSPSGGYALPQNRSVVNAEVENAVKSAGMTPEEFTKLKTKYPEALSGLGIN